MLTRKLGPFTAMQLAVLIVAFAAAAGGSYSLLRFIDDGTDDVLASDEQLVPAQIGDLITTVSTDGSLVFPISETVVFESSGVIGEVLVAEGDIVTEGQILATLNAASVAGLEKAVVQAQLDLYEAQESLAEATADPDSLDIASAEATIEEALVSLQQAQDDRDALVAEPPDSSELAAAASSLANAALAIQDAEDLLADLTSGPDTDAIADAEEDIAAAMTALANAEDSYAMVYGEENDAVAEARADLDFALETYTQLFVTWLGVDPSLVDPATAPADHLTAWEVDLDALFDITKSPDLASRFLTPPDDPATVWHEPTIHFYIAFLPGGIVGTCDEANPPSTYSCVLLDFNAAWDAVEEERVNVDAISLDASKAIASADSAVSSAQDSLEAAQEALADLMVIADPLRVAAAEADLVLAREKFDDAKAALAELTEPAGPEDVAIAKAEAAITRANINVAKAREALADLAPDPTPLALALLEAEVTAAEFALEAAVTALDGTTLLAPIGGEVISVEIEPGNNATRGEQAANQQTEGILITDRNVVEIEGTVDEIDILAIDVNVMAEVTMAALPGETLSGSVTEIGSPTNQQGVVSFPVSVRLEVPEDLFLVEGLTATASIVTSEVRGVLLAPTAAVQGSFVQPFIRVSNAGVVEERPVELGASDDFWVVVLSGIAEGEQVIMPAPESGPGFATFGGGFSGGNALRALQGGGGRRGRN